VGIFFVQVSVEAEVSETTNRYYTHYRSKWKRFVVKILTIAKKAVTLRLLDIRVASHRCKQFI
jgi:hypothetical protein